MYSVTFRLGFGTTVWHELADACPKARVEAAANERALAASFIFRWVRGSSDVCILFAYLSLFLEATLLYCGPNRRRVLREVKWMSSCHARPSFGRAEVRLRTKSKAFPFTRKEG